MNPSWWKCPTSNVQSWLLLLLVTACTVAHDPDSSQQLHDLPPQHDHNARAATRRYQRPRREASSFEERFAAMAQQLRRRPELHHRQDALKSLTFEDLFADSSGYSKQLEQFEKEKEARRRKGHHSNQLARGFHHADHSNQKKNTEHSELASKLRADEHKSRRKNHRLHHISGNEGYKRGEDKHKNKGDKQKGIKKQLKKDENDRKKIFYDESDHQEYHIEYDSHDEYFDKHDQKLYKGDADKAVKEHAAHGEQGHSDRGKKHHHNAADANNYGHKEHEDHHQSYEGKKGHKEAKAHSSGHGGKGHPHHGKGSHSAPKVVKTNKGNLNKGFPGVSVAEVAPQTSGVQASLHQGASHGIKEPSNIQEQSPQQLQELHQLEQSPHSHRQQHKLSPEQVEQLQLLHQYQLQQLQLQQQQQHLLQQHQHEEHERLRKNGQLADHRVQAQNVPVPVVTYQPAAQPLFVKMLEKQGRGPNNLLTSSSSILYFADARPTPAKREVNTQSSHARAPTPTPTRVSISRLVSGFKQAEVLQNVRHGAQESKKGTSAPKSEQRGAEALQLNVSITQDASDRLADSTTSKPLNEEELLLHLTGENSGGYGQKLSQDQRSSKGSKNDLFNSQEPSKQIPLSHKTHGLPLHSNEITLAPKQSKEKQRPEFRPARQFSHPQVYHEEIESDQQILHSSSTAVGSPPQLEQSIPVKVVAGVGRSQLQSNPEEHRTAPHSNNSHEKSTSGMSQALFVHVSPEEGTAASQKVTTASDQRKTQTSQETENYNHAASVEEMKKRNAERIQNNLKAIKIPVLESQSSLQEQSTLKEHSSVNGGRVHNEREPPPVPQIEIHSPRIISALSQEPPIQSQEGKHAKKSHPGLIQSTSVNLKSAALQQDSSTVVQQGPDVLQLPSPVLLPPPAQQPALEHEPGSGGAPHVSRHQTGHHAGELQSTSEQLPPQQLHVQHQQYHTPTQQRNPLPPQRQNNEQVPEFVQNSSRAGAPPSSNTKSSVSGILVQPKGLRAAGEARLTPDRSQQVSLVVHADQPRPASASGQGPGKDYHKSSAARKQLQEKEGRKKTQGAKKAEGFKKDHHKAHDKAKHKQFIDKGGHKHYQKQHQKSYEGHYKKGKKGKKGYKRGSKKISKKGHSDKGIKEHREKKLFAKKKKYYDAKDLEKHLQSHEDFDTLFDKHKKSYDKSGLFKSLNHDESFGKKGTHAHQTSHGDHQDHKKGHGKKKFFKQFYKHDSKVSEHTPHSSHDHFSNELHHEFGGHDHHQHGFSDFVDHHHEFSGSQNIEDIIRKMSG